MSPPASISGSTGSSTTFASDHDESRYLDKTRWLRLLRLGLAGATMAVSLVAVALESHSLREYHRTSAYAKWWLDLWPARLDQRPSVASIACGVIIFAMAAGYIVAAMLPSPRPRTTLLNHIASITGALGFIIACLATGLNITFDQPHEADGVVLGHTIRSWSCLWADPYTSFTYDDREAPEESIAAVDGFRGLCMETRASWILMMFLVVFEFAMCISAGLGLWLETEMGKKRVPVTGIASEALEERKVAV